MKKIVFSALVAFAGITGAYAQDCQNGSSINLTSTATTSGSYTVELSNSLCGSQWLKVQVRVNGQLAYNNGHWTGGNPVISANAGDAIEVTATSGKVDRNIVCVWAGEINACVVANQ
ncbi:MAG: hypothetical protein EP338_04820 [Bacteroidetes bacterium]|nr:MAG: hypothetical protein EP338_04820 [Bacteroidota bacterium]